MSRQYKINLDLRELEYSRCMRKLSAFLSADKNHAAQSKKYNKGVMHERWYWCDDNVYCENTRTIEMLEKKFEPINECVELTKSYWKLFEKCQLSDEEKNQYEVTHNEFVDVVQPLDDENDAIFQMFHDNSRELEYSKCMRKLTLVDETIVEQLKRYNSGDMQKQWDWCEKDKKCRNVRTQEDMDARFAPINECLELTKNFWKLVDTDEPSDEEKDAYESVHNKFV